MSAICQTRSKLVGYLTLIKVLCTILPSNVCPVVFSAKLKIWQVPACTTELRSDHIMIWVCSDIMQLEPPTNQFPHPDSSPHQLLYPTLSLGYMEDVGRLTGGCIEG